MDDLWPEDLAKLPIKNSPYAILKKQASLLGEKTRNLIIAEVEKSDPRSQSWEFHYNFNLIAPSLNNYHYLLLEIEHSLEMYPLRVDIEDKILTEVRSTMKEKNPGEIQFESDYILIRTESKFLEVLKSIFGSSRLKTILSSLISQIVVDLKKEPKIVVESRKE